jgi:hypothetical protein
LLVVSGDALYLLCFTIFEELYEGITTLHSESLDFAYPDNDENTIAKQVLVRFTS